MAIVIAAFIAFAFVIGVLESKRIVGEVHLCAAELHLRIARLEAAIKAKL